LQFRIDRFSKDVVIVQSDFDQQERILQALIFSQCKQEVSAKHRLNLKPVILFKAQRAIEQSRQVKIVRYYEVRFWQGQNRRHHHVRSAAHRTRGALLPVCFITH